MSDREPTLDEIEKALREATPGPWTAWADEKENWHVGRPDRGWSGLCASLGWGNQAECDAELITHSPEWLTYLCTRVREAEAGRAAWESTAETLAARVDEHVDRVTPKITTLIARAEAAEARVTALENALREFAELDNYHGPYGATSEEQWTWDVEARIAERARTLLAGPSQKPEGAETPPLA